MLKRTTKGIFSGISLLAALLPAAASAFGRWETLYALFAQAYALVPGIIGDYLRIAFYKLTLAQCSLSSRVSFGSFLPQPDTNLGPHVYIGSYCVIGKSTIGARSQIASGVQVLSGRHQHLRSEAGEIAGASKETLAPITIGEDCWIGAAAIVMADVGAGSTIGAGSVVPHPIPPLSVAVGNPARVIKTLDAAR